MNINVILLTIKPSKQSFVMYLLKAGHNIRTIQELLGHKHVNTTMIYTHVIRKKPSEIRSPLDG